MNKKVEKLTNEQEAFLPVFKQKWIDIGLSTQRVDPFAEQVRRVAD